MFTGIIESIGQIISVEKQQSNVTFGVKSKLASELKIDQSLAHNGVCLTVVKIENDVHFVTAISETLEKTNLHQWQETQIVNLERAMQPNSRLDGHFVQGHVDAVATCTLAETQDGSWLYRFTHDAHFANLVIEKGSICINGTSLTCFDVKDNAFSVAIIPYTYEYTSIHTLQLGSLVNVEFDILGKYIAKHLQLANR
jgi:riboflavin synthase